MRTSDFDYPFPEELIAPEPAANRDDSRLMVVAADKDNPPVHCRFRDIGSFLREGDLLVLNETRVIPARLYGKRIPGGGQCEVLLLSPSGSRGEAQRWRALVRPGKKIHPGTAIQVAEDFRIVVEEELPGGERVVRLETGLPFQEALAGSGNMPLPPYILARRGEKHSRPEDRERYQTVYARQDGSVAAPTAGLHFTPELLDTLESSGIRLARLTLRIGLGTFQPVTAANVEDHRMHEEFYEIGASCAQAVNEARMEGRRIIAVGTTSVRALEDAADENGTVQAGTASTDLMILPGYRFKVVQGLLTNFHLPRSTLLCLVSALVGRERLLALYEEATRERYRFYSYGDAMLILPR